MKILLLCYVFQVNDTIVQPWKLTWKWKKHQFFMGDTSSNGCFSMVMLGFGGLFFHWSQPLFPSFGRCVMTWWRYLPPHGFKLREKKSVSGWRAEVWYFAGAVLKKWLMDYDTAFLGVDDTFLQKIGASETPLAGWWFHVFFEFSSRNLWTWSNLTVAYFSKWVDKNHQLYSWEWGCGFAKG